MVSNNSFSILCRGHHLFSLVLSSLLDLHFYLYFTLQSVDFSLFCRSSSEKKMLKRDEMKHKVRKKEKRKRGMRGMREERQQDEQQK